LIVARSSVAKCTYLNSGVKKTMTAAFLPRHQKTPFGSPRRDGLAVTTYGERPREAGARYDRLASASSGSATRRLYGAASLRCSDSIRNKFAARRAKVPDCRGAKRGITAASAVGFRARVRPPGTEFLDAETGAKKRHQTMPTLAETKIPETTGPKSAQKRPIW